ncbi:hypothetical protein COK01_22535 [Priestia megaterium]|uniref:Uncharacterized protein n=1 Tax=Priestia megaterium TaxID=1404 RepID=A0AAE5P529_PRIMG|nr:hypothetical protein CN497_19685 [Priestia megaterium]RFB30129.1 hypothetical protein DZB87_06485 [Bacillus sp. ALD]PES98301.1 hypothetical protein CN510_09285 [Priestia megaterium]PEX14465.1 hypothetical protein CN451_02280 [Priestia megaterium]PFE31021.1 hypothetical protein CN270_27490 [Priestia megaterium]
MFTAKYKALTIYLKRGDKCILVERRSERGIEFLIENSTRWDFFIVMVNVGFMYAAVLAVD